MKKIHRMRHCPNNNSCWYYTTGRTYEQCNSIPMSGIDLHARSAVCKRPGYIGDARALDDWCGELHISKNNDEIASKNRSVLTGALMALWIFVSNFVTALPSCALSSSSSRTPGGILKISRFLEMNSWNYVSGVIWNSKYYSQTIIWLWVLVTYAVIFGNNMQANKQL